MNEWWKPVAAILLVLGLVWVMAPAPGGTMVVRDLHDPSKTVTFTVHPEFDVHLKRDGVAVAWSGDSACFAATNYYGGYIDLFDRVGHHLGQQIDVGNGPNVERSLAVLSGCREVLFFQPEPMEKSPNVLAFWDVYTGRPSRLMQSPDVPHRIGQNWAIHFQMSSDEKKILTMTIGPDIQAVIYDVENLSPMTIPARKPYAASGSFFPDHKHIAFGSHDGHFSVIDLEKSNAIKTYEIPGYRENLGDVDIGNIGVSPDGEYIMVGIRAAYPKLETDSNGKQNYKEGSGTWLYNLKPIKILRVSDGQEIASTTAFPVERSIKQVQWDPKDRFCAFLDITGTVFLWPPGGPDGVVMKLKFSDKAYSFNISPDGTRLAITHGEIVSVFSIQ